MNGGGMFTCIACSVAFRTAELQRAHYKADWHRYNLKRKVAELKPITLADFQERMARHEEKQNEPEGSDAGYCLACRKGFATDGALQNHLRSKKHLEVASAGQNRAVDMDVMARNRKNSRAEGRDENDTCEEEEEVDSGGWDSCDEGDAVPVTDCLFCPRTSSSLESNAIHMTTAHSFFLPDPEYVSDLEGLMEYLGAKVGQGHVCLWCDSRSKEFRSLDAVRKHMVDKGHCKVLHEGGDTLAEFADFYDFSKSYPEGGGGGEGGNRNEEEEEDEEEEGEVVLDCLDDSGYELTLPSGAKVGHRSLMRYYRQSFPAADQRAVVTRRAIGKVLGHYKSLGWTGITGPEAKKKERDVKFMRKVQQKSWVRLGTKANKLQKHWRDPTMLY